MRCTLSFHLSPSDIAANSSIGGNAPTNTGVLQGALRRSTLGCIVQGSLVKVGMYNTPNLVAGLNRMHVESSGNPNAINLWDANAQKGTPSMGLMQVIDPTSTDSQFGYSDNIWDPFSNILGLINSYISYLPKSDCRLGWYSRLQSWRPRQWYRHKHERL